MIGDLKLLTLCSSEENMYLRFYSNIEAFASENLVYIYTPGTVVFCKSITLFIAPRKHFFYRFFNNSEAKAIDLLERYVSSVLHAW